MMAGENRNVRFFRKFRIFSYISGSNTIFLNINKIVNKIELQIPQLCLYLKATLYLLPFSKFRYLDTNLWHPV